MTSGPMSVYSDSVAESRPPSEGPDLFDDEDRTDMMLKSLVQCNGLQKSWGFIIKKIEKLEKKQQKNTNNIQFILKDYVPRAEFHELVEVEHAQKLVAHGDNLSRLNKLIDEHGSTLDGHETRLVNHEQRAVSLEATREEHIEELKMIEDRSAARHEEITHRLNHVSTEIHKQMDKNYQEHLRTKADHEKKFEEVAEAAKELERRMKEVVDDEVEKLTAMVAKDYISEVKMLTQQQLIKTMVRDEMVTPLRADLEATDQRHLDLARQTDISVNDIHRLIRNADQRLTDTNNKFTKVTADIMDEVEIRAKRSELEETEANLRSTVDTVSKEIEALKEKVVAKLNEFVDHFAKVQETIDDHEHCLRHHAEELENRATKYDLLVQQNRIDRCPLKEDVDEEFSELKQVVEWQTDKIENFALTTAMMGGGGGGKKRKSVAKRKSVTDNGEAGGEAVQKDAAKEDSDENDDEGNEEGGGDFGNVFLLGSQLESLALCTVGLAHSTLREPKLGESRQDRLQRDKELLDLLGATRHWITHKTAPGGWDPTKLLSVGLQYAHPVENGPRMNLPQMPKSVLQHDGHGTKDGFHTDRSTIGGAGQRNTFVRNGRNLVETPRVTVNAVESQSFVKAKDMRIQAGANTATTSTKVTEMKKGLAGLKGGFAGDIKDLQRLEGLPMLKA